MTNEELLSLAARAHGNLEYIEDQGWIHVDKDGKHGARWNPWDDDADLALLISKFHMSIQTEYDFVRATSNEATCLESYEPRSKYAVHSTSHEAMRTAVIKVAAIYYIQKTDVEMKNTNEINVLDGAIPGNSDSDEMKIRCGWSTT